jgi:glutamate racemase
MADRPRPIGVFDSGIGGLTVASAISKALPNESLFYFGDTVHMPYGDKTEESIRRYSIAITKFLLEQGAKAIVIACNSASAAATDAVVSLAGKEIPVINVIDPTVNHLRQLDRNQNVGVIGTKATVRSQVYPKRIHRVVPDAKVHALATPLLAPIVEEGLAGSKVSEEALKIYLNRPELKDISSLLLACTHYPLLHNEVQEFYKGAVEVIDSARLTAQALREELSAKGLLENWPPQHRFCVSELTEAFEENAKRFFGKKLDLQEMHVHQVD